MKSGSVRSIAWGLLLAGSLASGLWRAAAEPVLPKTFAPVCAVQAFGAKGDGSVESAALQRAIDACAGKGGGVVRLAGAAKFVSGPLDLKSHITLEIASGTTLEGATDHALYTEAEIFREHGRRPLLMATGAEDIVIRGGGTIDGHGETWWPDRSAANVRPRLIIFDHCNRVLMENITVKNSPSWQVVPYYSDNLTFRNMTITAPEPAGHNTDGIDPFSSQHVLIEHVTIDTGDDNVAIKSGQPGSPGPDRPSQDITVRDCDFRLGHGLSVGSEVAGGVNHLLVERVSFKGTTQGIRIKSGRDRGADVGDFVYRDITMQDVRLPIQITEYYGTPKGTNGSNATPAPVTRLTPHFHNITIENLKATGAKVAMEIDGLPEAPIQSVTLKDVVIDAQKGATIRNAAVNATGLVIHAADGPPLTTGPGVTGSLR